MNKILHVAILVLISFYAHAATITSTATGGAWNSGSTWVGGAAPSSTDNATIASGATVTVATTETCATLTVSGTLDIVSGGDLSATANSTINSTGSIDVQGGAFSTSSGKSLTVNGGLSISSGTVTIGVASVAGSDLKGSGTIDMTGGLLQLGHDFATNSGLNTYSGGTVEFMGQTGGGSFSHSGTFHFYNLQVDAACTTGPGLSTKNGNVLNVTNNLEIQSGGIVDLAHTKTNTAYSMTFGGVVQSAATYGSTASSAAGVTNKISQFGTASTGNELTITCTVSISAAANPVCAGASNLLTATGVGTYTWSPGTNLSATTGSSVTSTATATTIFTVTATGCWTNTYALSVNPLPTAAPTNDGAICAGGTVNLTANASGASTYSWSGANLSSATATNPTATPTATGTYSLTATSSAGCASTVYTTTVTLAAIPSASPTNDGAICTGGTVNLTANATGGIGAYTYTWSGANLSASTIANPSATPTVSGTYSVTVSNSASGCISSVTTTSVTVSSAPAASPTSTAICNGGTATLTANASGGIGAYSYAWTGSNLSSTTAANPTATPTTTTTYSLTVTNAASGCTSSVTTVTATVNSLPAAYAVGGGGTYCQGSAVPHITLSASTSGINYKLYRSGTLVATMAGTGAALDLGPRAAGYTFTVVGVDATTGCSSNMTGSTTITMNGAPTAYTVTGGGAYCSGGSGLHVGLSNSAVGINYQLLNGTSTVGSALPGTGAALDFGLQTAAGTAYTVLATNATTGCTKSTTSSVAITVNPLPWAFSVTGGGAYCGGSSANTVGLSGTVSGTNYQLFRSPTSGGSPTIAVGSAVAGTGSAISFGIQSIVGKYTVVGTNASTSCSNNMTGNTNVTINAEPTAYSVTGGGSYCSGGAGVHVGLANSSTGINYQLYVGSSAVGSPIAGTGSALDFGLQTSAGTYTVIATDATTGCTSDMTGSVSITINTLPAVYNVTGGGQYCSGGSGVHVGMSNSASGINYQLYVAGTAAGSALSGTGSALDFGLQTYAGACTVMATDASTGCNSAMSGTISISTWGLPTAQTVTGGGSYCSGGSGLMINVSATQNGFTYQLYNGGSATGSPVTGTGGSLSFGAQTAAGTYSVVATDNVTGWRNSMGNRVGITINALPVAYSLTGSGAYCQGTSGATLGLANSQSGVNYQLYHGTGTLVSVGSAVSGTGSAISFGPQTLQDVYSVIATNATTGCTNAMSSTVTVTMNAAPANVSVTGGGNYCSGTGGVHVGTAGSCVGISYQLYKNGTATGSAVTGAGVAVDFGLQTATGSYTVVATNTVTACYTTMSSSVTVSVDASPAISGSIYTVAPSSTISLSASLTGGTWSSSATSIATVASTGDVTGVSLGASIISYTMPTGCLATQMVSVTPTGFKAAPEDNTSGSLDNTSDIEVQIAPNPSNGAFTIKGELKGNTDEDVTLDVINVAGQVVYHQTFTTMQGHIEQSVQLPATLSNGLYLLSLQASNQKNVFRLIINK